ncbi:hypothetical protein PARPLA_00888 [Rhodobacteraceae bacterium THAF1]|uniref:hypothetical protein n=1 Tax=Palleronia sp. THAF1 TaxID=2587842 RepID=UPI000F3B67FB|nr:hypothetical protein [Palleronia sp. THAF1]QFU07168.1 hypothetical protein FIU81_00585 [Palleronia sp. THAF1]VDC19999.1 hypothetical protein PARPLA_00888 [Rhodobacteraceae bacterium THAF1]
MPLDKLIDLLAEAAVRKLSQEREKQDATPDAIISLYRRLRPYDVLICLQYILQLCRPDGTPTTGRP